MDKSNSFVYLNLLELFIYLYIEILFVSVYPSRSTRGPPHSYTETPCLPIPGWPNQALCRWGFPRRRPTPPWGGWRAPPQSQEILSLSPISQSKIKGKNYSQAYRDNRIREGGVGLWVLDKQGWKKPGFFNDYSTR